MARANSDSHKDGNTRRVAIWLAALPALGLSALGLTACGGGGSSTSPAVTITSPGAPSITTVTAGDARATIAFTAPATDGGAAVTGYAASCTAGAAAVGANGAASPIQVTGLVNGTTYRCLVSAINASGTGTAAAAVSVTPVAPTVATAGTAGVLCGLSGSAFNSDESVGLTATYDWTCGAGTRVLTSNGVPDHEVGTFPGPGNPNRIAAVATTATYTLTPAAAASATGVITSGYALNGVKMEPATAGTCDSAGGSTCSQAGGTGTWAMEALGQTAFNFGTDENNAHVQPNGAYHYHGMPERLLARLGKGTPTMTLTGWAPDGFPIYARHGYNDPADAASGVKVMRGSYRLKAAPDAGRPATGVYPMGAFTQDYEYVTGLGDLDECNGRTGVTPEFPKGTYHYMVTDTYPFIGRCVKGTPASIR